MLKLHLAIASFISYLISPPVWILLFFVSVIHKGLLNGIPSLVVMVVFVIIMPYSAYALLIKSKAGSDIDLTKKEERYPLLAIGNSCMIGLLLFLILSHQTELIRFFIPLSLIIATTSLVTVWYKISMHVTFTYMISTLMNMVYGFNLWYLYLAIPLVIWSRLTLKKHTFGQVMLPLFIDSLIFFIAS